MKGDQALSPEIERLRRENQMLKKTMVRLEEKIEFLTKHKSIALGISGETLIAKIVKGNLSGVSESFDVTVPNGALIEVKYAKLNLATKQYAKPTKRWAWSRVFGNGGKKRYDYLVLIGEKDDRWEQYYKEPSAPFVLFCVPYGEVASLVIDTDGGRFKGIQLTSNPLKAKSRGSVLFSRHQVTASELVATFGI